jgi:hypothetical protein
MKSINFFAFSLISIGSMVGTAPAADDSRTLYLFLHVTGQKIHVTDAIIKPMPFYGSASSLGPYRYTLLDQKNKALYSGIFPDPLVRYEDDFSDPANPKGGKKQMTENEAMIAMPALPDAVRIRFERVDEMTGKSKSLGEEPLPASATP